MSSVKVNFLAMSGVDLKMGVSSVDFTFCIPWLISTFCFAF